MRLKMQRIPEKIAIWPTQLITLKAFIPPLPNLRHVIKVNPNPCRTIQTGSYRHPSANRAAYTPVNAP